MPAYNMGSPLSPPDANPANGEFVLMSPFSGPLGSPFDALLYDPETQVYGPDPDPDNLSTGALSTGIGFGANHTINPTAPQSIKDAGFSDDAAPGVTMPDNTAATLAILLAIGGGRSEIVEGDGPDGNGTPAGTFISAPDPYIVQPLLGFGEGGSRDGGAGPAFTGFGTKMVTATGTVANGAAIETGYINRSGGDVTIGQSAFGSDAVESAPVS